MSEACLSAACFKPADSSPWRRSKASLASGRTEPSHNSKVLSSESPVFVPRAQLLLTQDCSAVSRPWRSPPVAAAPPSQSPAVNPWAAAALSAAAAATSAVSATQGETLAAKPWRQQSTCAETSGAFIDSTSSAGSKSAPWKKSGHIFVPRSLRLEGRVDDLHLPMSSPMSASTVSTCIPSPVGTAPSISADTCTSRSCSPAPTASEGAEDAEKHLELQTTQEAFFEEMTEIPMLPPMVPKILEVIKNTPEVEITTAPLSVLSLLRWRGAVDPMEGLDVKLAAEKMEGKLAAVETPAASLPERRLPMADGLRSEEKSWRPAPAPKLKSSEHSFAAHQVSRKLSKLSVDVVSDEDVVRAMKSILNKLTVEKFDQLASKLVCCGIRTTQHFEVLIQEIFDKATTQHHFIDMYADLCALLHTFYAQNPLSLADDPKISFKKVLLNCCQSSFEKHRTPPAGLEKLPMEERQLAEVQYKMRMIGNIRFVGALLVRKMLASKVMLAIMQELIEEPTAEALESLAALLNVVGPTFDTPDFAYRVTLNAIFKQLSVLIKKQSVDNRARCLLKDVIDVRATGWNDRRPKKIDGPSKLQDVAKKVAAEDTNAHTKVAARVATASDWEQFHAPRLARLAEEMGAKTPTPYVATPTPKSASVQPHGSPFFPSPANEAATLVNFDREVCRLELSKALAELFVSHDVPNAVQRVADVAVPVTSQADELCALLVLVVEVGAEGGRKVGFELIAGLFLGSHWALEALHDGLNSFLGETFADLKCDVPALPIILREEVHPAFSPLAQAGLLQLEQHSALLRL